MIILTGKNGSGKTFMKKILVEKFGFKNQVSYTTREMRPGEKFGVDYNFVSKDKFEKMIDENQLEEFQCFKGNYYGVKKDNYDNSFVSVRSEINNKNFDYKNNVVIYLDVPIEVRFNRMVGRGDKMQSIVERLHNENYLYLTNFPKIVIEGQQDKEGEETAKLILNKLQDYKSNYEECYKSSIKDRPSKEKDLKSANQIIKSNMPNELKFLALEEKIIKDFNVKEMLYKLTPERYERIMNAIKGILKLEGKSLGKGEFEINFGKEVYNLKSPLHNLEVVKDIIMEQKAKADRQNTNNKPNDKQGGGQEF